LSINRQKNEKDNYMVQKGGLGRGLASLIPKKNHSSNKQTAYTEEDDDNKKQTIKSIGSTNYFGSGDDFWSNKKLTKKKKSSGKLGDLALRSIMEISVEEIVPNPHQPRHYFDQKKLKELSWSIKRHGILQPLVVTLKKDGTYELVAGERRLEASKLAGLTKVPVILKKMNEATKLEVALVENIQRHNLSPIEEARAYKKMQDVFDLTQREIADKVGKSRSTVTNAMRLLQLPMEIQRALEENKISEGHARSILAIKNPEKQRAMFQLILKNKLNVRQTEKKIQEVTVGRHKRRINALNPQLQTWQEQLAQKLGTKVKIKESKTGGQIIIDYYSTEELGGIIEKIN